VPDLQSRFHASRGPAMSDARLALPNFNNITVRIADVTPRFAYLGIGSAMVAAHRDAGAIATLAPCRHCGNRVSNDGLLAKR
jgi:hypothetical protein